MSRFFRTYDQAIEFIFGRINYERVAGVAYSADDGKLERMRRLLSLLDRPDERLPVVHIAGTKGKGSTSVMIAEILSAAGYRTGLFTSPHVAAFEERMVVDGESPAPEQVVELVNRLVEPVERMDRSPQGGGPTYFELATALAWLYFLDRGAEVAVLEVGLGGRLDATNVCRPLVGVITNISRDHTNVLGSSLAQIAAEKAGIVKPGIPLISGVAAGPADDVVERVCRREASPLHRLGRDIEWRSTDDSPLGAAAKASVSERRIAIDVQTPWGQWTRVPVPLRGLHQASNAALAVATAGLLAARNLRIASRAIYDGMSAVRWPARIEVIAESPLVVVDAAHNWASTEALARTLESQFSARRRILVFAATKDKDVGGLLRLLLPRFDTVILTQYRTNPRGVAVEELAALAQATSLRTCHVAADAASAWQIARRLAARDDLICITGSFFIATELRAVILNDQTVTSGRSAPTANHP
ncbi:MAG TPA: folylpolyglutamate synthase/dihydrofolate synthase family protein [Planctomycetaceae bacterium]|jgi:dihydrofolate synthase/folylpolyglutamate synthase|nr:folylpolyglutamate synthase/dihydrofolate synthase family protein [Planctomycetaceae bacterium]